MGRLTAIENTERKLRGSYIWIFQCDCGNVVEMPPGNFNSGHTRSCGCLSEDARKTSRLTHGLMNTGAYKSWVKMRERCNKEYSKEYKNYGERGIKVCERWDDNFQNFYDDMGDRPAGHSLDRVDNSRGYSPDNCRWATQTQQGRNKYGLQRNNKTGVKGVKWDEKYPGNFYAVATWRDLNGNQKSKSFSVKKLGKEMAFELAVKYRKAVIDELNDKGANYGLGHFIEEKFYG